MKLEMPSTKKQNDFYPYCGCETEDVCEPCPHCGMCAATVDYCACWPRLSSAGESLFYDPYRETLGG